MPEPTSVLSEKVLRSTAYGYLITGVTALPINFFNAHSTVATVYGIKGIAGTRFIYEGKFSGAMGSNMRANSLLNFLAGLKIHVVKEAGRGVYKGAGVGVWNPMLQSWLPKAHAELAFAATMSVLEMAVNPLDYWRVCLQANEKPLWTFKAMYAGAGLNGFRQFGTWWGFSYSTRVLDESMKEMKMDPSTIYALAAKAPFQSLFFTTLVYGLEAIKTRIQYAFARGGTTTVRQAAQAAARTALTSGVSSLFPGMAPKIAGNAILAFGAALVPKLVSERMTPPSPSS